MRKIFFVAALCVAGLASANNVKDGKEETKNTQKEVVVSSESGKVVESEVGLVVQYLHSLVEKKAQFAVLL